MLRKAFILMMVLVLACSVCLGEAAESASDTSVEESSGGITADIFLNPSVDFSGEGEPEVASFDFWQGHIGNIAFALPGMPATCIREGSMEECWNDSMVAWGHCAHDHMEYEFRTADIAPWIDSLQKAYPEDDPAMLRYEALYGYANAMIERANGQTGKPGVNPATDMMLFSYTYPDTPGRTYWAKCYLDGTQAVVLYMGECEHCEEAMNRFTKMTEEEREKRFSGEPYWLFYHGVSLTFPSKPYIYEKEGRASLTCLADDFTRIITQYINVGLTLNSDNTEEIEKCLQSDAEEMMDSIGGGTLLDGSLSGESGEWIYEFTFLLDDAQNGNYPDAFTWRGWVYYSEAGIWRLMCNDTETGRAFMDSIGEVTDATINARYRIVNITLPAEARKEDGSPASLGQFIKDLTTLLQADEDDGTFDESFVTFGDAMWCNGHWVRTVMFQAADLIALLFMSSDKEDALINEIHVIVGDSWNESALDVLASCCAEAAEGKADSALSLLRSNGGSDDGELFSWKGERYEAAQSFVDNESLPYHLMTVKALNPVPQENEPAEAESSFFADPAGTVKEFRDRWYRLNWNVYSGQFSLHHEDPMAAEDGTIHHLSTFGDSTAVMLVTESEDSSSGIVCAQVYSMSGDMQQTFLGGCMALASLTQMPDEQYYLMTMMLLEYPLWGDLKEMLPVAGWNGKQLVLDEFEYNGNYIPTAYILDLPVQE